MDPDRAGLNAIMFPGSTKLAETALGRVGL
jgi:hypothetical protein